ncbi:MULTISPECIES: M23 family metallopeptidase [Microbacterium]|uniref:M23 family metallopeptidase n=1 Tax=Microbacterium TaxID=33882 RepID=UPI001F305255|nr:MULTISPECIES: M23 family metallopeptidase [Microbacterium]
MPAATPAVPPTAAPAAAQSEPKEHSRSATPTATIPRGTHPRTHRAWAKTKALSAALAVGALITGMALPSLNPDAQSFGATAEGVSALKDAAQSYSSTDEIRAEIAPRGNFSATTPTEIDETRSRAVAAALAAGMPLGSAVEIPIADRVVMPLAAGSYSFTDGFGASRPGRSHMGLDLAAPVGTPINAAMAGCVSRSTESFEGYGVTIQIESVIDGEAVSTVYSHMIYGTRAVQVGECVTAGQYIGDVGSTGYVFGSVLHFEVHISRVPVDPMPWLTARVG